MGEADVAVVRELFAAFDEGDLDRAVATVTEDFELVDIAADQTFQGPAGLRQWLETFRTALPEARTELVNTFGAGGRVATEHIGRGTHKGPFVSPAGTIPATGRRSNFASPNYMSSATARSSDCTPTTTVPRCFVSWACFRRTAV